MPILQVQTVLNLPCRRLSEVLKFLISLTLRRLAIRAVPVTLYNNRFVKNTKNQSNVFLKLNKVFYLLFYLLRGITLVILKYKQFNLRKYLTVYRARYKDNLFKFRNLFSLKYKEQVLLYKLVKKLIIIARIDIRLISNYTVITSKTIRYISINRVT